MASKKTINSLYIHIPFCNKICNYCDFSKSLKLEKFIKPYLNSLIFELKSLKINHKLKTIYIGGGTPSCVDLEVLFIELQKYISNKTEFTIECNVLDINENLLKQYKKYCINRISLGIQSMNDIILKFLGREHTKNDVYEKIKLIKKYIKNINIDLIYGFNKLTNKILKEELVDYINLDVNHISTYSLEINKNTIFGINKLKPADTSFVRKQFDIIFKELKKHNFIRYEISNFSKFGFESNHNKTYWKDDFYYGIGLSAASYINSVRYKNTMNLNKYINKNYDRDKENISINDDKLYYLMLNLRLINEGINLLNYKNRFNEDLLDVKKDEIDKLIKRKLIKKCYDKLVVTYEGSMLLDIILRELF